MNPKVNLTGLNSEECEQVLDLYYDYLDGTADEHMMTERDGK